MSEIHRPDVNWVTTKIDLDRIFQHNWINLDAFER